MKKLSKYSYIVVPVIVVLIGFLRVILEHQGILIFEGDSYHQMYQFYLGGWERVHAGSIPLFDYAIGFGGCVMAMFYYLFSPFFLLAMPLAKEMVQYAFLYLNELKIVCIFIFTYLWAKRISKHSSTPWLIAFMMAFGGWTFSYLHLNMFLDAYLLYPVVFYFIEQYLDEKKVLGLCLSLAATGIINYYFMYMLIPFACIYALIRYLIKQEKIIIKDTFIEACKFFGYVLLAVGMACIILIPVAFIIKSNPRFDELQYGLFDHLGINELFKVASSFFVPVLDHEDTTLFISLTNYSFIGWGGGASLYLLMCTPLLLPGVFGLKDKKQRNIILCTFALLGVFVFFKKFWILFQLNMESRWFYMISWMMAYTVIQVHEAYLDNELDKRWLLPGLLFALCGVWGCYGISFLKGFNDVGFLKDSLYIMVVLSVLVVAYFVYYLKLRKTVFLVVVLALESVFCMDQLVVHENIIPEKVTMAAAMDMNKVKDKLKEDDSFYRVMINEEYVSFDDGSYYRYTTSNTPYANNINGLSFYSTIYNSQTEDFMGRLKTKWQMDQRYTTMHLYNLLDSKYYIEKSYVKALPAGYEFKEAVDDYRIYENKYWVELGYGYHKTLSRDAFDHLGYLEQDMALVDYLVTDDTTGDSFEMNFEPLGSLTAEDVRYYDFWEGPISNCNLYFDTGTLSNVKIELFYQDQILYAETFFQYNYIELYIPEDMKVDRFIVTGNEEEPVEVFAYVEDLSHYDEVFEERYQERFENVVVKNNHIEADIHMNQSGYAFTSVPYDVGWDVYVDGNKVDSEMVQLGFVGFKLDEGDHHVEMKYHIPYLKVGALVSLVSCILLFILSKKRG